eukprot:TRINITY_DN50_c0_g1_i22.p1 TRINITY_DN50_c0_g1~~TRINITY_DN50_c0_g1_i22.p1  ORF type:complete len:113 (-),score=13.19 TRINITY_DN50_c0_g1_i22:1182-1520(-)
MEKRPRSSSPERPLFYGKKRKLNPVSPVKESLNERRTLDALKLIRKYYESNVKDRSCPPLLLKSQLYSLVTDRTVVDTELVNVFPFPLPFVHFKNKDQTSTRRDYSCVSGTF